MAIFNLYIRGKEYGHGYH